MSRDFLGSLASSVTIAVLASELSVLMHPGLLLVPGRIMGPAEASPADDAMAAAAARSSASSSLSRWV